MKRTHFRNILPVFYFSLFTFSFSSCTHINVFEKDAVIPQYQWQYNFTPSFQFNIADTTSEYNLYIVLRHTDAYNYNNICLMVSAQAPGDTVRNQRVDLQLGTDATGWQGSGMDDIWEIRKAVTNGPIRFHKPGDYKFAIAQTMRENPLKNVMSIGIRVEKVK